MVSSRIDPPFHSTVPAAEIPSELKTLQRQSWIPALEVSGKPTQLAPCFYKNQCLYWGLQEIVHVEALWNFSPFFFPLLLTIVQLLVTRII